MDLKDDREGRDLFELHETIGRGAYGSVYRATDKKSAQVLAVKVSKCIPRASKPVKASILASADIYIQSISIKRLIRICLSTSSRRRNNLKYNVLLRVQVIDLDHPDNEDILEIQREVALLSQLPDASDHNITRYYGCWLDGSELWITMDYASGGSIRTLVSSACVVSP